MAISTFSEPFGRSAGSGLIPKICEALSAACGGGISKVRRDSRTPERIVVSHRGGMSPEVTDTLRHMGCKIRQPRA